jgi:hypothetical protein
MSIVTKHAKNQFRWVSRVLWFTRFRSSADIPAGNDMRGNPILKANENDEALSLPRHVGIDKCRLYSGLRSMAGMF